MVRSTVALRRSAGIAWIAVWVMTLYVLAAPWRAVIGLVDELARWSAWLALYAGLIAGAVVGRVARLAAEEGGDWTWRRLARAALGPAAVVSVSALGMLAMFGPPDWIGVVVLALASWWAGLDLAFGAVPLLDGRPCPVSRPLTCLRGRRGPL